MKPTRFVYAGLTFFYMWMQRSRLLLRDAGNTLDKTVLSSAVSHAC